MVTGTQEWEVFYQKSFEQSLAFSPQASNMVIIMETLARNHLKADKDLVLVWLLPSISVSSLYILDILFIFIGLIKNKQELIWV